MFELSTEAKIIVKQGLTKFPIYAVDTTKTSLKVKIS